VISRINAPVLELVVTTFSAAKANVGTNNVGTNNVNITASNLERCIIVTPPLELVGAM
jgi:hypothetical protein